MFMFIAAFKNLIVEFVDACSDRIRHKIYWLQIIDALPKTWKDIILKDKRNAKNLVIFDHHNVRNSQICSLKKLTSKELYLIISRIFLKTSSLTGKNYIF